MQTVSLSAEVVQSSPKMAAKIGRVLNIWLAEDDPHIRLTLELTLKRVGHQVRSAESADVLLDFFQAMTAEARAKIDLLVTDLNMPGKRGEELIRELDGLGFILPVVVITAYGSIELESEFNQRGNVTILNKPFHPDDLISAVLNTRLRFEMELECRANVRELGAQITVLVADDSAALRTRLAALVGHVPGVAVVEQAANASEVWACLRRDRPRVALMDVYLDDRGGGFLLRQIKQEFPALVLVALTRYAGAQFATTYRDFGADYCFDKTTELDAVLRTLAHLIQPNLNNETEKETHDASKCR